MGMNIVREIISKRKQKDFTGLSIDGKPGCGKTAAAIRIAREIGTWDFPEKTPDEIWEWAICNIVYDIDSLFDALDVNKYYMNHKVDNRRRILIFDDAGVEAGSMAFADIGFKTLVDLKKQMDIIRSSLECLIITSPSNEDLSKFIKHYGFYKGTVRNQHGYNNRWQKELVVQYNKMGKKRHFWMTRYVEPFSCYINNKWFYNIMEHRQKVTTRIQEEQRINRQLRQIKKENELLKMQKNKKELEELVNGKQQ